MSLLYQRNIPLVYNCYCNLVKLFRTLNLKEILCFADQLAAQTGLIREPESLQTFRQMHKKLRGRP